MIPGVNTDYTTKMQKLKYRSSQSFISVNQDTQFWFNVIILHLFIRGEMSLLNRFVDKYKKMILICICSFSLFLINSFNCLSYKIILIIQAFVEYMHKIKFEWKDLKSLFGRPGPSGLKCTSAAASTLQQTVACGLWGFNQFSTYLARNTAFTSWIFCFYSQICFARISPK